MKQLLAALLVTVGVGVPAGSALAAGDAAAGKAKSMLCMGCHGMNGHSMNPMWPKLAGQHAAYIAKQLRDFKKGARKDPQMAPIVGTLTEEDIDNLAAFYAAQKPK